MTLLSSKTQSNKPFEVRHDWTLDEIKALLEGILK